MGCGSSLAVGGDRSNAYNNEDSPRHASYSEDDDEEEHSPDTSSITSNNRFTVATTGNKLYTHNMNGGYSPGVGTLNIDEEIERWKAKNKQKEEKKEKSESSAIDEFVFGDFKVDPADVKKQKVENLNRVRVRRSSLTVYSKEKNAGKQPGAVIFNDFVVPNQVDEGDDPEYFFFHEKKVPPGFVRLKKYSARTLLGHCSRVKTIAIAPNDMEYASAAIEDSHLTMTSMVRDGEETGTFIGHTAPIISAVFSRDGRYLATSSRDNTVIVWNMSQKDSARKQVRTLEHPTLPICACFSSDGQLLITGCQDRICRVWDIESKEQVGTYEEHEGVVVCAASVPGEDAAVTGGGDRIIRMWSTTPTPTTIRQFIGHDGVVISVNITPDAEKLLSNDDRACKMWNISTGACVLNVTLESLTKNLKSADFPPPMPLPKHFVNHVPIPSKNLGLAPNGILGPQATGACKIGSNRAVFTLSCLCPGELSCSYFAVACTNRVVYIVSCATGQEEVSFHVKASVFAINAGRDTKLLMGDIFGNCYSLDLIPEGYDKEKAKELHKNVVME